jgi:hypothetical protein
MILGDIVHAIQTELKYLFLDREGSVIIDTDLKDDIAYNMPLCIIEIGDGAESARLPGNGISRLDFDFALRVYNYEPNAYNEDDGGYATSLLDIVDIVRNYFENEAWQTQEMVDLTSKYGFRLTFTGLNKAESLQSDDKIIMGYRIMFSTIAFDQLTNTYNDYIPTSPGTNTVSIVFQ